MLPCSTSSSAASTRSLRKPEPPPIRIAPVLRVFMWSFLRRSRARPCPIRRLGSTRSCAADLNNFVALLPRPGRDRPAPHPFAAPPGGDQGGQGPKRRHHCDEKPRPAQKAAPPRLRVERI